MSRALARASHWLGLVCLAGAFVGVTVFSIAQPSDGLWPTLIAIVPMALLLVTLTRHHTVLATVGYLFVGAACTYVYSVTILSHPTVFPSTDMFIIALPIIALVMVGGAGGGALIGVLWSSIGLVLGESAVIAASVVTGVPYRLDWFAPAAYVLIATILVASVINRGRSRGAQSAIHQASARDGALSARRGFEGRATALVHDTALSHLVAISAARPGPLDPRLGSMISRDLEVLFGGDWLLGHETAEATVDWAGSPLAAAIDDVRAQGLSIEVTGDRSVVAELTPEHGDALGLATRQCLVNVLRHAGVSSAEVSVGATDDEVTAIITDAGAGFDPDAAPVRRLGLRHSVFARIEEVGGSVHLFSRPGAGTTVLLAVPRATASVEGAS